MGRYRVRWSAEAVSDLEEIIAYIARDSIASARRVGRRIHTHCARLTTNPQRCHLVFELAEIGVMQYRELICTPYKAIFRIAEKNVFVLAVLDGRRDLQSLLLTKLLRRPDFSLPGK